jgi:hypothetical protein
MRTLERPAWIRGAALISDIMPGLAPGLQIFAGQQISIVAIFCPMTDAIDHSMATQALSQTLAGELDTTSGSLLHLWPDLLERIGVSRGFMPAALYFSNVMLQFVPLLIGAWLGSVPLLTRDGVHRIPFLLDFSALSSYLIAYPCVFTLVLTDQRALRTALSKIQLGGALIISPSASAVLAEG